MFRIRFCLLAFLFYFVSSAQNYSVSLSKSAIKKYSNASASATLFVVITNEKNNNDAALVSAAKNYWKKGPVKFISRIEFINQMISSKLQAGHYYLYEWLYEGKNTALKYIDLNTLITAPNTGYYALSLIDPALAQMGKTGGPVNRSSMYFNLGAVASDQKGRILESYYDLMLKHLNHEITLVSTSPSKTKIRKKKKNGYFYFNQAYTDLANKDVLLVKEQVEKKVPGVKKKKKEKEAANYVDKFKLNKKNIYTVFPEDVSMALKKNDAKVVLYCSGMLISAEDGSVLASPIPSKTSPVLLGIIGTGVASAIATISYILARQN